MKRPGGVSRVLVLIALLCASTAASHAQRPKQNSIGVVAFDVSDTALASLAKRLRDTVAVRLAADSAWSLISIEPDSRPRDRLTGLPVPLY